MCKGKFAGTITSHYGFNRAFPKVGKYQKNNTEQQNKCRKELFFQPAEIKVQAYLLALDPQDALLLKHLKDIGDNLLFRIKCTETTGGRPLRLQMDYLYSPATASWQFYSEE